VTVQLLVRIVGVNSMLTYVTNFLILAAIFGIMFAITKLYAKYYVKRFGLSKPDNFALNEYNSDIIKDFMTAHEDDDVPDQFDYDTAEDPDFDLIYKSMRWKYTVYKHLKTGSLYDVVDTAERLTFSQISDTEFELINISDIDKPKDWILRDVIYSGHKIKMLYVREEVEFYERFGKISGSSAKVTNILRDYSDSKMKSEIENLDKVVKNSYKCNVPGGIPDVVLYGIATNQSPSRICNIPNDPIVIFRFVGNNQIYTMRWEIFNARFESNEK